MGPVNRNNRPATQAGFHSRELLKGIGLAVSGGSVLVGLLALSRSVQLDSVLVASQAIYNVISGVNGIVRGIGQLLLGLAQMLGFSALALVGVSAVLAVGSGSLRIGLKLLPQMEAFWTLLARAFNGLIRLLSLPQRPIAISSRSLRADSNPTRVEVQPRQLSSIYERVA